MNNEQNFFLSSETLKGFKSNYASKEELLLKVEELAVSSGFQLSKSNGNTEYVYLLCNRNGKNKQDNKEKQKQKVSKKTGKIFVCSPFII